MFMPKYRATHNARHCSLPLTDFQDVRPRLSTRKRVGAIDGCVGAAAWPGPMLVCPRTQSLSPICDRSVTGFSRKIGTDPIARRQVTDLSCEAVAGRTGDEFPV